MKDNLFLFGKQLVEEMLTPVLQDGEALKSAIEEIEAIEEGIREAQAAYEALKAEEEGYIKRAEALRKELKEKSKSLGGRAEEKYNEFAGGSLTVVRLELPNKLVEYATGYPSVSAAQNRIEQLKSTIK